MPCCIAVKRHPNRIELCPYTAFMFSASLLLSPFYDYCMNVYHLPFSTPDNRIAVFITWLCFQGSRSNNVCLFGKNWANTERIRHLKVLTSEVRLLVLRMCDQQYSSAFHYRKKTCYKIDVLVGDEIRHGKQTNSVIFLCDIHAFENTTYKPLVVPFSADLSPFEWGMQSWLQQYSRVI